MFEKKIKNIFTKFGNFLRLLFGKRKKEISLDDTITSTSAGRYKWTLLRNRHNLKTFLI